MRLICPNCDAQYEVPDDVIPENGRDVQCSDCGNTWFQAPAGSSDTPPIERQPVPPEVSEILQEEAEYEREARAREGDVEVEDALDNGAVDEADPFEDVPLEEPFEDLSEEPEEQVSNNPFAVDPDPEEPEESEADRRARETQERMARMRGIEANNPFTAASDSRKGVLPDVDKLNSSLSPDPSAAKPKASIDLDDLQRKKRRGSGFRTGFTLMVFLGLFVIALYITHVNLGRAIPVLAGPLDSFATYVDQWRVWVDVETADLVARLNVFVSGLMNS